MDVPPLQSYASFARSCVVARSCQQAKGYRSRSGRAAFTDGCGGCHHGGCVSFFLWWLRRLRRLRWRLLVLDRWSVGLVLLTSPAILVARLDHLLDERKDASRELVCELNGVLFAT
jgi:hypothetical protein